MVQYQYVFEANKMADADVDTDPTGTDTHEDAVEAVRDSRYDLVVHPENEDEWIIKSGDDILTTDRFGARRLANEITEKLGEDGDLLYTYASVVRLTMDDPVNENATEGDVRIEAGACQDGVAQTVLSEEKKGFVDVTCEVLERFEADTPMSEQNIREWATLKAKRSDQQYE